MPINFNDDGSPNVITYLCTDLSGTDVIAELPFRNASWSWVLNGAGSWSATLPVEDPRVQAADWLDATAPNKTCLWVDINGTLVWGGVIQTRRRHMGSDGLSVKVGANDHWAYFGKRVQAQDYSTNWATSGAGSSAIADQILSDVMAVANSLPVSLAPAAAVPSQFDVTLSWPSSQRMAVKMVVQQLSQMGWQVGFDLATDVAYVSGVPTATITLSYPRRGRVAGTTGLIVDVTGEGISFDYDEDGTQQAVSVYEMGSAAGGVEVQAVWDPAMATDGYPLLESVSAHSMLSPTPALPTVLQAMAEGDLSVSAYPVVTPTVTLPMFSDSAPIGSYIVGDDISIVCPTETYLPTNPLFPNGLQFYFRIIKAEFSGVDKGVAKQTLTLAVPPASTPVQPPS